MSSPEISVDTIAKQMAATRRAAPLVHNITNYVVMNVTANTLLAAGASPAMVHAGEEVMDFVPICSSLVVNIGTLSPAWSTAMRLAIAVANEKSIPWVFDPVGVGISRYRNDVASHLTAMKPSVLRGNAGEIMTLAGDAGVSRGVDSRSTTNEAERSAVSLAQTTGGVVAITGAVDVVTDGYRIVRLTTGDPLMARVTGTGCSASAITGAYIGANPKDLLLATASALAVFGAAGKRAAKRSQGPGSLQVNLLDELHTLTADELADSVKVTESIV